MSEPLHVLNEGVILVPFEMWLQASNLPLCLDHGMILCDYCPIPNILFDWHVQQSHNQLISLYSCGVRTSCLIITKVIWVYCDQ